MTATRNGLLTMTRDEIIKRIAECIMNGRCVLVVMARRRLSDEVMDEVRDYLQSIDYKFNINKSRQQIRGEGCATFVMRRQDRRGMKCDYLVVDEDTKRVATEWIAPYYAIAQEVDVI